MTDRPFTRAQLARALREHAAANLFDESVDNADGAAIYTLSDPREIRRVRYVGQTNELTSMSACGSSCHC
jgi:hypothetical protein